jgi:hypothetical protein
MPYLTPVDVLHFIVDSSHFNNSIILLYFTLEFLGKKGFGLTI